MLVMLCATLFGLPLPLLPIQILWMNLVTDGIPALALAVDPKAPDLMSRPPRRPDDRLLDQAHLLSIGGEGLMLALIALGAFSATLFLWGQSIQQARTVTFTVMVLAQLVHAFNSRSDRLSLIQLGMTNNRHSSGHSCCRSSCNWPPSPFRLQPRFSRSRPCLLKTGNSWSPGGLFLLS